MLETLASLSKAFGDLMWGSHLVFMLVGAGIFFSFYMGFKHFLFLPHSIALLRGKHKESSSSGHISHFAALSTALSATVGMGNVAGVAVAIKVGGPGAVFWMWVCALLGMSTKFFTCSLAIKYRGKDSQGVVQGGPMYVIKHGLAKKWSFLAYFFAAVGLIGALPSFQVNQLVQIYRDFLFIPMHWASASDHLTLDLIMGVFLSIVVGFVVIGGLKRTSGAASYIFPVMVIIYMSSVLVVLLNNVEKILPALSLIFSDAFSGKAAAGGSLALVVMTGIRRGAFSNEAGIGTEALAHGAAQTSEPIKEGIVAMLGPLIDTLFVCSSTALAILVTGVWKDTELSGVSMTMQAFSMGFSGWGEYALLACITLFSISTIFSYSFYGYQCCSFLWGAHRAHYYYYFYVFTIIISAVVSLDVVLGLLDGAFALMAFPTTLSALLLAKKVKEEAKQYFAKISDTNYN